ALPPPDASQFDAAWIRMHDTRWDPWDAENACVAWFLPTPGGMAIAREIKDYIEGEVAAGRSPWFLDQIALFAARSRATRAQPPASVGRIPRESLLLPQDYANGRRGALLSMIHSLAENHGLLAQKPFLDYVPATKRCFGWVMPGHDTFFDNILRTAPVLGGHARWEHALILRCIGESRSFRRAVDAGAHVGFWSLPLAGSFEFVEAFESHWLHQECFEKNIRAENVRLHRQGLGATASRMASETIALNSGMSRMLWAPTGDVEIRALDEFAFDDVDFMKIDVEGFELPLLEGARQTLLRCRPLVLIEHGDHCKHYGFEPGAALRLLESLGARQIASLGDDNYLYAWDEPGP
ncbi:MAG: FkbM family methyltransferase, partial [Burkholderiales bacterium]